MRMRLAKRALEQALWGRGLVKPTVDFSQMTYEEVEQLWYAAGELSRQARIERQARLHEKVKGLVSEALKK